MIFRQIISGLLISFYVITFLSYRPVMAATTPAPNYACGIDKNGDGSFDSEGEYATCVYVSETKTQPANRSCPSGYSAAGNGQCSKTSSTSVTYACPNNYVLKNGQCEQVISQPAYEDTDMTCRESGHPYFLFVFSHRTKAGAYCANSAALVDNITNKQRCNLMSGYYPTCEPALDSALANGSVVVYVPYYCPADMTLNDTTCSKEIYTAVLTYCPANYIKQGNTCILTTYVNEIVTCPSGWSLSNGICSTVVQNLTCPLGNAPCIDLNKNKPVDEGKIDGSMLVDDGKKTDDGVCLDQLLIFNGRAQDCKLAGIDTAYKNCCKSEGKVFTDSAGAMGTVSTAASTVSKVYGAAQEAYTYYSVAMQATGDAAVASSMAAQGFGNAMIVAFDPTTLAISIAIYFAMQYLMKACDQMSMETAMQAGSGYCHQVGTYCKKKIPLLGCVQKATSYCCFNSKLARIIHEQGRPQLKNFSGWGDAGAPQCRGFSPDEFQALDFSKIDLSEYVEDMVKKATDEIQSNVNQITQDFYEKTN